MEYLKLANIRINGGTQPRVEINNELIEEYAEAMRKQDCFPPLEVVFDGVNHWLYDGFHRFHAAVKAGLDTFPSNVENGTQETARWLSLTTNQIHGLRRTNADKRKAVETALQMKPEMSDNAIAQHCGVSQPFVSKVRNEISAITIKPLLPDTQFEGNSQNAISAICSNGENNKRVGLDGKNYPVPIPMPMPEMPTAPAPQNSVPAPQNNTVQTPLLYDTLGREIPDECIELWKRKPEVQELLTALSKVRGALTRAQDDKDILYKGIHFSVVMAGLDRAYTTIKTALPYVVCPICQGLGSCRACDDRGMISQYKWDTVIPQETKEQMKRIIKEQD